MCVLHGDAFTRTPDGQLVTDLSDIIFYMDFSGIFDRSGVRKKHLIRQEKAKALFRPEGVSLDFGSGPHRYLAFERSGSMSRQARLSFIREDFYDAVRRRIMMDMTIGDCQLSKLYAYNGLMLSSGIRIDGIGIDRPHRVVVIDNPTRTERNVSVITVEDDGTQSSTRKYHRVEKKEDIEITCFDGEGLISKEYARVVDEKLCGKKVHTSFQIRMPYVKGMLHEVDFKDFLTLCGTDTITDLWGVEHSVRDVDVILTKSMFKGYGWLTASGMSWNDYWNVFRKYRHALYITNVSKEKPEQTTELNYQFLTTVSIQGDEFRPADLPDGWDHSPETDERNWLTKQTELAYYNFCTDESFRQNYFLEKFERVSWWERHQGKDQILAAVLKKNPRFINEPVYARRLEDEADKIVEQYAVGRLIVAGDNRYLSGDLLDFLAFLLPTVPPRKRRQRMFYSTVMTDHFPESSFYAPQAAYAHDDACTLLRNPHIARNEELQLSFYDAKEERKQMRHYYFGHLTDVVMVDSNMLAAERLGGADYDGDMIKTISDSILNACVRRNYNLYRYEKHKSLTNTENIPLLMIPTAQPQIRSADDWEGRFETVHSTFSSRVGQICNAALDRSIIAYNENSDAEERTRCREETETLAILTGLEIDSAKSGIRPDLDEYLTHKTVKRSAFLKYKTLVEDAETRRAWYEPTHAAKIKAFFKKVDWDEVDSNVERLPYLAQQDTVKIANIAGSCIEDYCAIAERLSESEIDMFELNISCPNVKQGGAAFGTSCESAEKVVKEVRRYAKKPMIVKLSPNVTDIASIAQAVEAQGADAVSLINTLLGMRIDINTRRPILKNNVGGLSGPAIFPVAVRMVWQVANRVKIPVIGMGGIEKWQDAIEMMMAGANAIQIGAAMFYNPKAPIEVIDGMQQWMQDNGVKDINEIVGTVQPW